MNARLVIRQTLSLLVLLSTVGVAATKQSDSLHATLKLKQLGPDGTPVGETTNLSALANRDRSSGVVVYLWEVHFSDLTETPISRQVLDDLASLSAMKQRVSGRNIISVVTVWPPGPPRKRDAVYARIHEVARSQAWSAPLYIDVSNTSDPYEGLGDALAACLRLPRRPPSMLFWVEASRLDCVRWRDADSIPANVWAAPYLYPESLVIDAIDLPVEPTSATYWGGALYRLPQGLTGASTLLHSAPVLASGVPPPPPGFRPLLYLSREEFSRQSNSSEGRIGPSPAFVTAESILGRGAKSRELGISDEDARTVLGLDARLGLLADWRVTIVYGAGARLVSPASPTGVIAGAHPAIIEFSCPMEAQTLIPENVWMEAISPNQGSPQRLRCVVQVRRSSGIPAAPVEIAVTSEELKAGQPYRLLLGSGLRTASGKPLDLPLWESLPEGVVRQWTVQADPYEELNVYPKGVSEGAKVRTKGAEEWQKVAADGTPLRLRLRVDERVVELQSPGGQLSEHPITYDRDAWWLNVAPPEATGVRIEGWPQSLVQGQTATLRVYAVNRDGEPLATHTLTTVSFLGERCSLDPDRISLLGGERTVQLTAVSPGEMVVRDLDGRQLSPEKMLCTGKGSEPRVELSAPETPTPERLPGRPLLGLAPSWLRWLSEVPVERQQFSVSAGRERTRLLPPPVAGADPADGEYLYDPRLGLVKVSEGTDHPVEIQYRYRQGRCGLVLVVSQSEQGRPIPVGDALRAQFTDLLAELGYLCVEEAELLSAFGPRYQNGTPPTQQQVEAAREALNLDEVFVIAISPVPERPGRLRIRWEIWPSPKSDWSTPWSPPLAERRRQDYVVLDVTRDPLRPFDARALRKSTDRLLDPWLQAVKLSFPVRDGGGRRRPTQDRGGDW